MLLKQMKENRIQKAELGMVGCFAQLKVAYFPTLCSGD